MSASVNASRLVGTHDVLWVTLDTLRYDVAAERYAAGRTPHLAAVLPPGGWERRHTPGTFTFAAHAAFFAGFLPTPARPGPHPRPFALRFPGSETTTLGTAVFDAPDVVTGLRGRGYHTVCVGGVGFFNKLTPLGSVLPGLFDESHWAPELGVTDPRSTEHQVDLALARVAALPPARRVFLFVNVSAVHQPNRFYLPGAAADSPASHAAALEYADGHLGRLFAGLRRRGPWLVVICSDHGTAYGEDGYAGHRLAHPVVWDVPYAEFVLPGGAGMTATDPHPVLEGSPYRGYVYAYPHKTAYRRLDPPRPLRDVWAAEPRGELFLYAHVPFCTMRCAFCNLFTTPNPKDPLVPLYLDALRRQAEVVRATVPDARFTRFAVGGGTPTYLDEAGLGAVFDVAERVMGADLRAIPAGVEVSPDTLTPGKVALLKARGVDRVSIGVQSFVEAEAAAAGRPQSRRAVEAALALLAAAGFGTVNVDLIYGLPGQTVETWLDSLRRALGFAPQELYLYPLYVRPLTGLGRSRRGWDDVRPACYRAGRDVLLGAGYEQVSMRMFRRAGTPDGGPAYCCQEDGMIGLGCGARSYTRGLHYALDYAVGPKGVKAIIADYLARDAAEFARADHGFELGPDEQRRRYLLQSILHAAGLDAARYAARFGTDPAADFPDLRTFADLGLIGYDAGRWVPTAAGLERSDVLGPWFFSARVRSLMAGYEPR